MPDGEVILGEQTIGVFTIHFDGTILFSLNSGESIAEVLETAGDNGMRVELQMTPEIPE